MWFVVNYSHVSGACVVVRGLKLHGKRHLTGDGLKQHGSTADLASDEAANTAKIAKRTTNNFISSDWEAY